MSDMQDSLERAHDAALDAETAKGKAEQAYEQVLADETYEYIVQVHREGRWQFYIGESRLPTDSPGLAVGFSQKKHAEEFAKAEFNHPTFKHPTRIVRRRVSPPEVINE